MSGNPAGGLKAAKTTRLKYGNDFYDTVAAKGGKAKVSKGFAKMEPARLREVSAKGGRNSSRAPKIVKQSLWQTFFKGFSRGA